MKPEDQYANVDEASRQAFFRRFTAVIRYNDDGTVDRWDSYADYADRFSWARDPNPGETVEQLSLQALPFAAPAA